MKLHMQPHYRIGYIEELMAETTKHCTTGEKPSRPKTPEALASAYKRPDKAKVIKEHKSRLKHDLSALY